MYIVTALRREERKLENEMERLRHRLQAVRAAADALGGSPEREVGGIKKRVWSEARRAKFAEAARARWARTHEEVAEAVV